MKSCIRIAVIILVAGFCSVVIAEQPASFPQANVSVGPSTSLGTGEVSDANLPAMPFLGEITSDDVYVRSGPGTNYYYCGKVKRADKVKVVGSKFSWWQIVPPKGSYCWISKQYVEAEAQDSTTGTVMGDAVRVYAGSDDVQPMHSTTMLVKLNNGDKVTLLGEEKEGYCKISPPDGAYLWVSNQYARSLGSLTALAQPKPAELASFPSPQAGSTPDNDIRGQASSPQATSPNEPPGGTPGPSPLSEQKINEVRQLKERVDAEKAKPSDQRNFTELKKAIEAIASDNEVPNAARRAQDLLRTIERCELAQAVAKAEELQEQQIEQTRQRIENARAEQLAKFEDLGIFAVIGQIKESPLFAETPAARYYRIVDSEDKMLCYARPTGAAMDVDLRQFIDRKVGLVGTIEASTELGNAIVRFTNIVGLE